MLMPFCAVILFKVRLAAMASSSCWCLPAATHRFRSVASSRPKTALRIGLRVRTRAHETESSAQFAAVIQSLIEPCSFMSGLPSAMKRAAKINPPIAKSFPCFAIMSSATWASRTINSSFERSSSLRSATAGSSGLSVALMKRPLRLLVKFHQRSVEPPPLRDETTMILLEDRDPPFDLFEPHGRVAIVWVARQIAQRAGLLDVGPRPRAIEPQLARVVVDHRKDQTLAGLGARLRPSGRLGVARRPIVATLLRINHGTSTARPLIRP